MEAKRFISWATTHAGTVRSCNEDALIDRKDLGLWAVADGAGGHSRGDFASRSVVEALGSIDLNLSPVELLALVRQKMAETHEALRPADEDGHAISASTVVVLVIRGDHYACLWAGDSRCYRLRDGMLEQITRDHSLVQELLDAGAIMPEQAESHPNANVITRAVGSEGGLDLDKVSDRLMPGDRYLLCSDGLYKAVPDDELAALLASAEPTERLVAAALERRGRDNITAVAIEVLEAGRGA
jgi:protein phosphatase/serine/threonine-protein phosphatase Stp1